MKYKIVYTIDSDASDNKGFYADLDRLADILKDEFKNYGSGYNWDRGGKRDIKVSLNCKQISKEEKK